MSRKASTFRIDPPLAGALEVLARTLNKPMNQLVNEALRGFLKQRSAEVESELESTLAQIRKYRELDPAYERAIDQAARAEAQFGTNDPLEGVPFKQPREPQTEIESNVHKLLNG